MAAANPPTRSVLVALRGARKWASSLGGRLNSLAQRISYDPRAALSSGRNWAAKEPRARILAYAISAATAVGAAQTWFEPGKFIASGDSGPFIRDSLLAEVGSLWGHELGGAGAPSYQIVRFPELAAAGAARALGASEALAQRWFLTLILAGVAIGATYFAFGFVKRNTPAAVAGALAVFNPFVLQHSSYLPLWAIAVLGLIGGLLVRAARGDRQSPIGFAVASVLVAYLALNPPMLLIVAVWIALLTALGTIIGGPGGTRRAALLLLRSSPWCLVLNLFWLGPYLFSLLNPGGGRTIVAQTDVRSWSWTHARSSIPNVLTLSNHWGWSFPEYFPYAESLERPLWAPLKFALPLLALSAPLAVTVARRRAVLGLVGMAMSLVLVGKGLHEPLTSMNLFLYDHVPGMWLLREPSSKIGPMLLLLLVALAAVSLEGVVNAASRRSHRATQRARRLGVGLVACSLLYPFPLWTGAVVPDERPLLPSAHVKIPDEWRDIATLINRSPASGKVLVLPLIDYYQVPTTWGYYGTDAIPNTLLTRPTISPAPGGYFGTSEEFAGLVRGVQNSLVRGDTPAVPRLLRSLGVSHLIVRHDIDTDFPGRRIEHPRRIERGVTRSTGLELIHDGSMASVYVVKQANRGLIQTRGGIINVDAKGDAVGTALASLPLRAAGASSHGRGAVGSIHLVDLRGPARVRTGGGTFGLARHPNGNQFMRVAEDRGALLVRDATSVLVDGKTPTKPPPARLELDGAPVSALTVDGNPIRPQKNGVIRAQAGAKLAAFGGRAEVEPMPLSLSDVKDCHRIDDRSLEEVGITAKPLPTETQPATRLIARDHSACVFASFKEYEHNSLYRISFDYRTVSGKIARLCVQQLALNRCAQTPRLKKSKRWKPFDEYIVPEPGSNGLRLYLYADAPRRRSRTVTDFRGLRVALHRGTLPALDSFSEAADCFRYDDRSPADVGIGAEPLPDEPQPATRLRAADHAACISGEIEPFSSGTPYRIRLNYRTIRGRNARMCLWQEGIHRCAPFPPLGSSSEWRLIDEVVVAEPGTTGLKLFLYADGPEGRGETVVEYRGVKVQWLGWLGSTRVGLPPVEKLDLDPGLHTFRVKLPLPALGAQHFSDVGDCHRYDSRSIERVGISAQTLEDEPAPAVSLRAEDHAACVTLPVEPFTPDIPYRLRFDYRSVEGKPARACLLQDGANRCASVPDLKESSGWSTFDEVIVPEPRTNGLRLLLYADASSEPGATITQYRDVHIDYATPFNLTLLKNNSDLEKPPTLKWTKYNSSYYRARIGPSHDPFVVVLSDTYAPGWELRGLPPGREAKHITIDGYSNGWILSPGRATTVDIRFRPNTLAIATRVISLLGGLLVLAIAVHKRGLVQKVTARLPRLQAGPFGRPPSD